MMQQMPIVPADKLAWQQNHPSQKKIFFETLSAGDQ